MQQPRGASVWLFCKRIKKDKVKNMHLPWQTKRLKTKLERNGNNKNHQLCIKPVGETD